jgi:hypothetical protein
MEDRVWKKIEGVLGTCLLETVASCHPQSSFPPSFLSNMPSRSFLSANSYANMCSVSASQPSASQPTNCPRRSPRLMNKARSNDLVRSVLNIPIYVPKLGVAADTYAPADRTHDAAIIKAYLQRGEGIQKLVGRDAILARTINAACIFIYLCEKPSLLKHHHAFREIVRNKRNEFTKSLNEHIASVKYAGDAVFVKTVKTIERIFSVISPIL